MRVRPAGYVRTERGMGLERKKGSAKHPHGAAGGEGRQSVDFKRMREKQIAADARRDAKAKVGTCWAGLGRDEK